MLQASTLVCEVLYRSMSATTGRRTKNPNHFRACATRLVSNRPRAIPF